LRNAGAERCYYDTSRLRQERADMVRYGLREGDTLLVYSLRNLGGSPVADKKWQKIIEDVGAQLEIVPAEYDPKPMGRPRHHKDILADNLARIEEIWRDPLLSERDRIQQCSKEAGRNLTRGWLHGRFPRGTDKEGQSDG
jgi:DNA invertase Pin-like site-specific DNA recombinase